jgi:preprotein translocase subunit SecE
MKTLNKICWIIGIVLGLGSLVLFFTDFATITSSGKEVTLVGAQLGFGSKVEFLGKEVNMAKSADILFCFILTVLAAAFSALSFKTKKLRYAAPAVGIVSAVYMLVIALSDAPKFVDSRPLPSVSGVVYTPFVLITAIALFAFTAFSVAHLLIDDYLEVVASKGAKLTILKRIGRFLRDYKSEAKKIVWPTFKDVAKNTLIVLIICLIVGAFIWAVDFGLAELLKLILGE